jgi:hypothetical protein
VIHTSLVVVATERLPQVGFLANSGLKIETGIGGRRLLQTSVPDVYAGRATARSSRTGRPARASSISGGAAPSSRGSSRGEHGRGKKRFGGSQEDYFWALFGSSLADRGKRIPEVEGYGKA